MEANYEEVMNFGKRSLWGLLRTSLRSAVFPFHPTSALLVLRFSISLLRRKLRTYSFGVGIYELKMAVGKRARE